MSNILRKTVKSKQGIVSILIVIIIIMLIFILKFPAIDSSSLTSKKDSIGILYFENNTGDDSLSYLGRNISDLMIADLSQSRFLRILDENRLYEILSEIDQVNSGSYTRKTLMEVAKRGNCDYLITGNFTKAGNNFRITAMLQNIMTEEQKPAIIDGRFEQIFDMVDGLTKQIKRYFEFSEEQITQDIDRPIRDITTHSREAYRFYERGKDYISKGEDILAEQNLQMATTIDPNFVMAYVKLSDLYRSKNQFSRSDLYMKKAYELKDRLSERDCLFVQASYLATQGDKLNEAIVVYKELLQLYPDDLEALEDLSGIYGGLEEYEKTDSIRQIIHEINPESKKSYYGGLYLILGKYDEALEYLKWYQNTYPPNKAIHTMYIWLYGGQGKFDLAFRELAKADSLYPEDFERLLDRGRLNLWAGNFDEAEQELKKALKWPDNTSLAYTYWTLWGLYLLQGRIDEAIEIAQTGVEWAQKTDMNFWEGFCKNMVSKALHIRGDYQMSLEISTNVGMKVMNYMKLGMSDEAQDEVNRFHDSSKDRPKNRIGARKHCFLQGIIELEKSNITAAIDLFKKALTLSQPNPNTWFSSPLLHARIYNYLAQAYYRKGEVNEAIEEYQRLVNLIIPKQIDGYIISKGNYELAKIYEELGKIEEATKYYKEFLHIWRDADEDLPELKDGKKRLANLELDGAR